MDIVKINFHYHICNQRVKIGKSSEFQSNGSVQLFSTSRMFDIDVIKWTRIYFWQKSIFFLNVLSF